jgi:hypothetical protein
MSPSSLGSFMGATWEVTKLRYSSQGKRFYLQMTRRLLGQLTEVCGCDDGGGTLPKHKPGVVCNVGWLIIYRGDKNPHNSRDTLLVTSNSLHRELVP